MDRKSFEQDVQACARCNGNHEAILFQPFVNAPPTYSHWATCPATAEPILLRIEGNPQRVEE